MKQSKSLALPLILGGVLILIIAIGNIFFDIPGLVDEWQLRRRISENQANLLPAVTPSITPTLSPINTPSYTESSDNPTAIINTPIPTRTPTPVHGFIPDRIIIESISLDAPVITAERKTVELKNQWFEQWSAPDYFAAGWQDHSAPLGMTGNTVINGHHNVSGKVFGKLVDIKIQDIIEVRSGNKSFFYEVKEILILKERDASLEERIKNASWIERTEDERLTLVTCHPKNTNTHRLLVIAFPVLEENKLKTNF